MPQPLQQQPRSAAGQVLPALPFAAAAILAMLLLLALPLTAKAAGKITAVDPPDCNQGDTLLLTITGTDLPRGAVVLEFFPQQIAVLSLLSTTETQILAQIKVPPLAPPGKYNIILYNQLGDEVIGEGLFTVLSDIVTPVFKDYDPKVIAQASSAFALVLSGDMVSRDAVGHLSMQWSQAGNAVEGLETSFAYASPTAVSVAVTGELPSGKLDGRILLDNKPIYFISIELPGAVPEILGHSPSRQPTGGDLLSITLVGTGFSQAWLPRLSAKLVSVPPDRRTAPTEHNAKLRYLDSSSLELQFSGATPPGAYKIILEMDGAPLYGGPAELLPPEETESPPPLEPDTAQQPDSGSAAPGPAADAEASSGPDASDGAGSQPEDAADPEFGDPVVTPSGDEVLVAPADPALDAGPFPLPLMDVEPLAVRTDETARFTLQLEILESTALDRLMVSLEGEGWQAAPLVQGTKNGNLVAVFELPQRDWKAGDTARLRIVDPSGEYASHVQAISLLLPDTAAGMVSTVPGPASGDVPASADPKKPENSEIHLMDDTSSIGPSGFTLLLSAGRTAEQRLWEDVRLASDDAILNANAARFAASAKLAEKAGRQLIELQFAPLPGSFDPLAWELLVDTLSSGQPVPLSLDWPGLELSLRAEVLFTKSD